jgi:hypothetical protein
MLKPRVSNDSNASLRCQVDAEQLPSEVTPCLLGELLSQGLSEKQKLQFSR